MSIATLCRSIYITQRKEQIMIMVARKDNNKTTGFAIRRKASEKDTIMGMINFLGIYPEMISCNNHFKHAKRNKSFF